MHQWCGMRKKLFIWPVMALFSIYLLAGYSNAEKSGAGSGPSYYALTPEGFGSYAPSNRTLDFKNIDYPLLHAAICFEINRARTSHGKQLLVHSEALEKAAFLHSRSMARQSFFAHTDPYDPKRGSPHQRMALAGVHGGITAENIAMAFGIQYKDGSPVIPPRGGDGPFREYKTGAVIPHHTYRSFAVAVVDGWMHSAGHRANILDGRLKFMGSGASFFEDRNFYRMPTFTVTLDLSSHAQE